MIKITKKDVLWSYFAQFFSVASGLITLPLILKLLSAEEIGMNYLMLSLGALVSLFDFGFTPQFGRNIAYVFSGAQELKKEGVTVNETGTINYRLLATMIHTAEFVYRRLAFFVLFVLLTLGTYYIYYVTKGFASVNNSLIIWVLYSIGVFFTIYYSYYGSLLGGQGLIMESKKASVCSRLVYIVVAFALLYGGLGLMGVVIANLIAPFVSRLISYHYFFTNELKEKIGAFTISKEEKIELFEIVWYNAKKLGLVFIGAYAINKLSIFLAGLYLPLSEIGSYGLMVQLFSLLSMMSAMLFYTFEPRFSSLRSRGDDQSLIKEFAFSMNLYYLIFIIGTLVLLFILPLCLSFISANTKLPSLIVMLLFSVVIFLEGNHSCFATLIVTKNNVPFVNSALFAGFFIAFGDFISLKYTDYGILGLVIVQGLVQVAYANWKWPYVVLKEFKINLKSFLLLGMGESLKRLQIQIYGR